LETLANIRVNTADTGSAVIKQAVGEAQRKAQRENKPRDCRSGNVRWKCCNWNSSM